MMPVERTREIGRRIASNASILLCTDILGKLTQAVFVVVVARELGVQRYGVYTLAFTVFFFLEFLAQFGIRPMAVREIARNRDQAERLAGGILILLLGGAFLVYGLLLLALPFVNYEPEVKAVIYLLALTLFPHAVSHTFTVTSYGFERMKLPSIISIASGLTFSSLGILVLYLGGGLPGVVGVLVAVGVGEGLVAGWLMLRNLPGSRLTLDPPLWWELIKQSLPFGVLGLLMLIHSKVDVFMLSLMQGPLDGLVAIGYYMPAYSILGAFMLLPQHLRMAMVPALASRGDSIQVMRSTLEGSTKFLFAFLSFPMIIATTFCARDIVTLVFGESYLPTADALRILGWAYAFVAATTPAFAALVTSRRLGRYVPWAIGIVLVNVLLNLVLIPSYSFVGAAVATLITETISWLLRLYLLRQIVGIEFSDVRILFSLLPPMGITFATVLIAYFLYQPHIPVVALLAAGVYVPALFVFKAFTVEDFSFLTPAWSRLWPARTPPGEKA
jgi:O-antigen/teichoic acid export membrane protein